MMAILNHAVGKKRVSQKGEISLKKVDNFFAAHACNEESDYTVLEETRNVYPVLFQKLKQTISEEWLDQGRIIYEADKQWLGSKGFCSA